MLRQIIALLAVATSVAFASTCGYCYPGYGGYCGESVLGTGLYNNGFYGSRVLSAGCATPTFVATVGAPEVISSCENSLVSPIPSAGIISSGIYGAGFGKCGTGFIGTAF